MGAALRYGCHTPPTGFDQCLTHSSDLPCPLSGLVLIQGCGKNQLSENTGGPGKRDHP
jgi:hypothetical protein